MEESATSFRPTRSCFPEGRQTIGEQAEKHLRKRSDDHLSLHDASPGSSDTAPSAPTDCDRIVDLDVSWLVRADLTAVDALARLQLVAVRRAHRLKLHGANQELADVLELVGLGEIVQLCPRCSSSAKGDATPTGGP